jgi:hypothetical protein
MYSLEHTGISKVSASHMTGIDVSKATKGIKIAIMTSKAIFTVT